MLNEFLYHFPFLKDNPAFLDRYQRAHSLCEEEQQHLSKVDLNTQANLSLKDKAVLSFSTTDPLASTELLNVLESLKPWRKGPFAINDILIDAEWRSDIKWQHVINQIDIKDKRVLDIGANNGYYMFRALLEKPKWVLGMDPTYRYFLQYHLFHRLLNDKRLIYSRLGHQDVSFFPKQFDVILCLGIIYHTTDPISLLKKMHQALAPGGVLILESQGIPGESPYALIPQGKYAGARGMWYVPTVAAIKNWLVRSGFNHVNVYHTHTLSFQEQRQTKWAPVASLKDFIDPEDASKTIEGYDAPIRIYIKAHK